MSFTIFKLTLSTTLCRFFNLCSQVTFSLSHDVIFLMVSPLLGRFLVSFNLLSAICGLQSAVCGLRSAVCGLRSAVCDLQSAVCGLQSAVCSTCAVCKCQTPIKDTPFVLTDLQISKLKTEHAENGNILKPNSSISLCQSFVSITKCPWTRAMKVVHGPGPKWGSMDPWFIFCPHPHFSTAYIATSAFRSITLFRISTCCCGIVVELQSPVLDLSMTTDL